MTKAVKTEAGTMEISYRLTERNAQYGVLIKNEATGESASAPDISPDRREIEALVERLADCNVTPTTLMDIIEDYLAVR